MNWIEGMWQYCVPYVTIWAPKILWSAVIVAGGWWAINKFCKLAIMFFQKSCSDASVASFMESALKFLLKIFLVVTVLGCLGMNITSLIAAIGASFVAIGISLKDSLSNVVSGIILIINKPVHVGDYIECDSAKGTVVAVKMLFTTLQTDKSDCTVIVPNSKLISNVIVRKSDFNFKEITKSFNFDSKTKPRGIKRYLEKEFFIQSTILQVPAPQIEIIHQESENNFCVNVTVWCESQHQKKVSAILSAIFDKLIKKCDKQTLL